MAKSRALLSFEWGTDTLIPALENLPREAERAVAEVVAITTDRAYKMAKNRTPVDRGDARNGWRQSARGANGRIFNNVPYINVLEFGGYPVTPAAHTSRSGLRRGRAVLGGLPPPSNLTGTARTAKAPGGRPSMRNNVSKQAPRGMVRSTLEDIQPRFLADLTNAINTLPAWE